MTSRWGLLATVAVGIPVFLIPLIAGELGIRLAMNAEENYLEENYLEENYLEENYLEENYLEKTVITPPMPPIVQPPIVQTPESSNVLSANQIHSSENCDYTSSARSSASSFRKPVEL